MEENRKTYPYKKDFCINYNGRSFPVWAYDKVPEGMRRATSMRDFYYGRVFLYRASLCDSGEYLTEIFRSSVKEAVARFLKDGTEIWVKV